MKYIFWITLFVTQFEISFCQDEYKSRLYLSASHGTGMKFGTKDGNIQELNFNSDGLSYNKGTLFFDVKNGFGVHLSLLGIGYWQRLQNSSIKSNNPDYYLLNDYLSLGIFKTSVSIGAGYKLISERYAFVPFFDFGIITHSGSRIDSYLLKEKESNNIKRINNNIKSTSKCLDFSFGLDVYYHAGKYWGICGSCQYDRFNTSTEIIVSEAIDFLSPAKKSTHKKDFKYGNMLFSIGLFVALFHK